MIFGISLEKWRLENRSCTINVGSRCTRRTNPPNTLTSRYVRIRDFQGLSFPLAALLSLCAASLFTLPFYSFPYPCFMKRMRRSFLFKLFGICDREPLLTNSGKLTPKLEIPNQPCPCTVIISLQLLGLIYMQLKNHYIFSKIRISTICTVMPNY
jgi:hypothetical protein